MTTSEAAAWRADDVHRERSREFEGHVAEQLVDHLNMHEDRMRVGRLGWFQMENLEDGPPDDDEAEIELYLRAADALQGEGEPLVYADDDGRRYEVEVDVRVRPLPDVETQLAQHDAAVAERHRMLHGASS